MLSVGYRILWGVVRESINSKESDSYRRDAVPVTKRSKTAIRTAFQAHA